MIAVYNLSVQWFEKAQHYAGTELARTAVERGVIAVVADRAEIYCLECAVKRDLLVVGEIFQNTENYKSATCDSCHQPILKI